MSQESLQKIANAEADISELIWDWEKQFERSCLEEWVEETEKKTEKGSCIVCGREYPETEFQKLFERKPFGICKRCWYYDGDGV